MTARQKKERPIIFSGPMIRTILDDRKTQTRRVIKPQPAGKYSGITGITTAFLESRPRYVWRDDKQEITAWRRCPYGAPGNRLWVRETWFPMQDIEACAMANEPIDVAYKADYDTEGISRKEARDIGIDRWRPSIFMPRWVSRITLEITDVRVERVQDIQGHDLVREGVGQGGLADDFAENYERFRVLWDSLNAKRGGWDTNPWVWVITFSRRSRT